MSQNAAAASAIPRACVVQSPRACAGANEEERREARIWETADQNRSGKWPLCGDFSSNSRSSAGDPRNIIRWRHDLRKLIFLKPADSPPVPEQGVMGFEREHIRHPGHEIADGAQPGDRVRDLRVPLRL